MTNSLFQDHDVGHIMFDIVNHVKFCMVMINRCLYNVIGYVTGQHKTWLSCSYERCHPCSTGLQVSAYHNVAISIPGGLVLGLRQIDWHSVRLTLYSRIGR